MSGRLPFPAIVIDRNSGPTFKGITMPDFFTLVLFAAAAMVLTATPGLDMLLIASRSVS